MTITELIKELEKIKAEHGDLPIKIQYYDSFSEEYFLDDLGHPEYYNPEEEDRITFHGAEECVLVGE